MKLQWSLALVLTAAGCLLLHAAAGAGDKKKDGDKRPEPAKDIIQIGRAHV